MNTHRFYGNRAVTTVLPDIESEDDLVNTDDDEEDLCNSDDDENTNPRRSGSSDDSYDTEPEIDEPNQIGALQTAQSQNQFNGVLHEEQPRLLNGLVVYPFH